MVRKVKSLARCLAKTERGVAATEFALLLPIMVMMFFGLIEASNAMTVNRKVAISANTLADLAAQSETLLISEIDDLFDGVMTIVEPNDSTGLQLRLISVVLDEEDKPVVHWSRDYLGNEPYAVGADYLKLSDNAVIVGNSSLIVVELIYTYVPSITNYFIDIPIVFDRQSIRWPRLVRKVQLCDDQGNCTT